MPDHSIDGPLGATRAGVQAERSAPARDETGERVGAAHERPADVARTDWRLGGRTVRRWREGLLALALFSVGAGMLAGILIATLWPSPWAQAAATALLWVGMLVPVVRGLSLSRPAGLLRIRPLDVLFGVALGGMLRLVQGWIESAAGGSGALPSYPLIDGGLDSAWWLTAAVAPVVVAPVVEELFFRGVVLVSVFTALRRPLGSAGAGLAAVLASTVLFVVVHASDGTASVDQVVSAGLVGLVSALLVTLTGRLGGAVLVHVVYNASFLALAVAGTFWA